MNSDTEPNLHEKRGEVFPERKNLSVEAADPEHAVLPERNDGIPALGLPEPRADIPAQWLAVRLGHMGDVVLTTGVLLYLGERFDWRFHVLTRPEWMCIFKGHPFVDQVIPFVDKKTIRKNTAHSENLPLVPTSFYRLRKDHKGFGLLDLHGNLRSRMLGLCWSGPVARYPKYGMERRIFLMSKGSWRFKPLRSTTVAQRYALAVLNKAPAAGDLLPRVFLDPEELVSARQTLAQTSSNKASSSPGGTVALHPFASHAQKTWPSDYWHDLVNLLDKNNIPWVAIGHGPAMFPGRPEDLIGRTSLRETCAILAGCKALVTADSGPMHLAAAVDTPVIALFGPTTREWGFYPAGENDQVLELFLSCRPCSLHGKKNCPRNHQCMRGLPPAKVMSALEELRG